ncbi:uncharacterized protein J4E78_000219 [Alternaria triticimaculans]|uniref:uncharacterized protein n=1 Tax=Alternaria triticimaculans TaxID=297637 RepID=UPI0020C1F0FA|nr:uncharacterized protein J4E78_000219 [Alternaria triticimaculans]KAI4671723.1 hypothetical protein J4E78_000219 [Alternaria triticimaculans]
MASYGRQTWDSHGTIQLLKESARRLLGEENAMTKGLGRFEKEVLQVEKPRSDSFGCIKASWNMIVEDFTMAIGLPLTTACGQFTDYCRILKADRNRNQVTSTKARDSIHQYIAELCIGPAKAAMSTFTNDEIKSQVLELPVEAFIGSLQLPPSGDEAAQKKLQRVLIEAAKTKRLLEDLEIFFKELQDADEYTL